MKSGDNTHSKGNKLYPPIEDAGIGHKDWHKTTKDILPTRNFRNTDLFYQSIEPPHGMIFCGDEMVGIDVNPKGMKEAHFATFPPKLIEPLILAGCPKNGVVLDPFAGSMTTAIVAYKHGRKFIMIELSETYIRDIGIPRIEKETRQLRLFR